MTINIDDSRETRRKVASFQTNLNLTIVVPFITLNNCAEGVEAFEKEIIFRRKILCPRS